MTRALLLAGLMMLMAWSAQGQIYRISATLTITNAPTTNGQTLTVTAGTSSTRRWTNNPALNPAVWIQTNATKNGSATNLFAHVAQYRFVAPINISWVDTNAIKFQGGVGQSLSITIGGEWASVTYATQLVSTPFTVPVRVPLDVETATNATNIASLLMAGLNTYSTNRAFNSLISTNARLIGTNAVITTTNIALTNAVLKDPTIIGLALGGQNISNSVFYGTNDVVGDWSWRMVTNTNLTNGTGFSTNLVLGTNVFVRLALTNAYAITGVTNGRSGAMKILWNPTQFPLSFTNASATSEDVNRILTRGGTNVTVTNGMVMLLYDSVTNRWILTDWTASGGGAAFGGGDTTNLVVYPSTTNNVALTVRGLANQSNDVLQVKNSSGTTLLAVDAAGTLVSSNVTASRMARFNANKQLTNAADVYRQIFVPAGGMISNITLGATNFLEETSSNDRMFDFYGFSDAVTNYVQFVFAMPREWDVGTLKAKVFWSSTNAAATQTAVWEIAAGAVSNDDPIDAAFGTAQTVSDDVTAANDLLLTAATSALTVGGTPAAEDLIWFRIARLPGDAADDLGGVAKLLGVWIQYREDPATEVVSW